MFFQKKNTLISSVVFHDNKGGALSRILDEVRGLHDLEGLINYGTTLKTSGEDMRTPLKTSGEDMRTPLKTSGERDKTTLKTSVEDVRKRSKEIQTRPLPKENKEQPPNPKLV
jgi:hypothetical protein